MAGQSSGTEIHLAAQRLEHAVVHRNLQLGQQYPLRFSFGYTTSEMGRRETLDDLVGTADTAMYLVKQRKRLPSTEAGVVL